MSKRHLQRRLMESGVERSASQGSNDNSESAASDHGEQ